MADFAAELFAHECCLSGEGKWDSGVCCCCHSFDANGCADAMCCAFAARSVLPTREQLKEALGIRPAMP